MVFFAPEPLVLGIAQSTLGSKIKEMETKAAFGRLFSIVFNNGRNEQQ